MWVYAAGCDASWRESSEVGGTLCSDVLGTLWKGSQPACFPGLEDRLRDERQGPTLGGLTSFRVLGSSPVSYFGVHVEPSILPLSTTKTLFALAHDTGGEKERGNINK